MALHILTMRFYIRKHENTHHEDSPAVIKNLNFSIKKGELVGICGLVGDGKTSLFNTLLGEMRCMTNRDRINMYVNKQKGKLSAKYDELPTVMDELDPRFD
jgi:ABC-type sugar transport system ATPase subunit